MGRSPFDSTGSVQIFLSANVTQNYASLSTLYPGNVISVSGESFYTNRHEFSLRASAVQLLSLNLHTIPYGELDDVETHYRQRYVDLLANPEVTQRFRQRSQIIQAIRSFLTTRDFLEVETPMLHPIPGGATARPFVTHHHTLDTDLYLRIAPELYLKRLIVGGMDRVFELNRSFRNEGISTRHNPEFTMLEVYQAYTNHQGMIDLLTFLVAHLHQALSLPVPEFQTAIMQDLVEQHNPGLPCSPANLPVMQERIITLGQSPSADWGHCLEQLFGLTVEEHLIAPTFVTNYPTSISPLARACDDNPLVTERFEFFVNGQEIANGFSELNDPQEQARRFAEQVTSRQAGDDESMYYDADYIRALEHGMPPTGGLGVGIDRLVMWLTGVTSIREVLLFPCQRSLGGP